MKPLIAAVCLGVILHTHAASAQNVASRRLSVVLPSRDDSLRVWTRGDSAERQPTRAWPTYMVAGAVIGGALVAGLALTHCDQNCQDDGALAFTPPFIVAGAAAGGLLGLGIGLIVDSSRRPALGLRISVLAP